MKLTHIHHRDWEHDGPDQSINIYKNNPPVSASLGFVPPNEVKGQGYCVLII